MPRNYSRKRTDHLGNSNRLQSTSNLSPNAPEFVPSVESHDIPDIQVQDEPIISMTFYGNSLSNFSNENGTKSSEDKTVTTELTTSNTSNLSQRDVLIDLLNSGQADCVVCYEQTANDEPIWSCQNCYQIFHLKCIMVWFLKSYNGTNWRCPACQNEVKGKPVYMCFCGSYPNPFSNNVDIPHSCGQVCGKQKKNSNETYSCHHKCTLLCHPGPCPTCVVQIQRNCGCGKTKVYVQCGKSSPLSCQNTCSKQLHCKNHVCEKICHAGDCDPCNKNCLQDINFFKSSENNPVMQPLEPLVLANHSRSSLPGGVHEEELRMLGIDPIEVMNNLEANDNDSHVSFDDENDTQDYDDSDDNDDFDDNQSLDSLWRMQFNNDNSSINSNYDNYSSSDHSESNSSAMEVDLENGNSTDSHDDENSVSSVNSCSDSSVQSAQSGIRNIAMNTSRERTSSNDEMSSEIENSYPGSDSDSESNTNSSYYSGYDFVCHESSDSRQSFNDQSSSQGSSSNPPSMSNSDSSLSDSSSSY